MRQKLGQHFLKNEEAVEVIIAALGLKEGEAVIEIGPGAGALTLPLLEACRQKHCTLIAIERDEALADDLARSTGIKILKGDALDLLPRTAGELAQYKLVGNIPYYITGHLLRLIGELEPKPSATVLMVQKEVALRASAQPPDMNLLAAATQAWGDVEVLMKLSRHDFEPPPEVESAIIRITPAARAGLNPKTYYPCIKAAFKQPRKKLGNNISKEILAKAGISPDLRAQNLSIDDLIRLSAAYSHMHLSE